ncbi:hypothetical protein HT031_004894 [Scenedesmus sp. PABB004]|nr:hypothetical protein HT031_004894 [Scenedesmus sp. PABB004]
MDAVLAELAAAHRRSAGHASSITRIAEDANSLLKLQRTKAAADAAAAQAQTAEQRGRAALAAALDVHPELSGSAADVEAQRLLASLGRSWHGARATATAAAALIASPQLRERLRGVRSRSAGSLAAQRKQVKAVLAHSLWRQLRPEQARALWAQATVAEHHRDVLQPRFRPSAPGGGAGGGCRCAGVSCGWCGEALPARQHLLLHVCGKARRVDAQLLQELAAAAGCEPTRVTGDGLRRCFLCPSTLPRGAVAHSCSALLWRLLVVDQSQLPWASPAEQPAVVLQQAHLSRLRRDGHMPVTAVFMCPPKLLPAGLRGKARRQEMLDRGTWPLLRSRLLVGPSSFVAGEQGLFALDEPDHYHDERRSPAWAGSLVAYEAGARRGAAQLPVRTRSLAGAYTGQLRAPLPDDEAEPSLAAVSVGGAVFDPCLVGGVLQMANLGHGPAALLEPVLAA